MKMNELEGRKGEGGFIFLKPTEYSKLPLEEWTKKDIVVNNHDNISISSNELTAEFKPSRKNPEFPNRLYVNDIETDIYSNGRKDTNEQWSLSYLNDDKEIVLVKVMWKSGKTQYFELRLNKKEEIIEISKGQMDEVSRYSKITAKKWVNVERII